MSKTAWIAGTAAIALVAVALAAPAAMDWSRFKAPLTERLTAATGREITISGPIGVRLLPSPGITVHGLAVANPAGEGGNLAEAARARVHLAVLPLLTGSVRVASLELDQPVIRLRRMADGRGNWVLHRPSGDGAAAYSAESAPSAGQAATTPGHIASSERQAPSIAATGGGAFPIDEIVVDNGTLSYDDGAGHPLVLSEVVGRVAPGDRSTPFKAKGAAKLGDTLVTFDGAVERPQPGRASFASLSVSLPGDDAALTFRGQVGVQPGGDTVHGRLALAMPDPRRTFGRLGLGLPLAEGALAAETELSVSGTELQAKDLTASLGDQRLTGAVSAAFGDMTQVDVRLNVAALNLDKWSPPPDKTASTLSPSATAPVGAGAPASTAVSSSAPAVGLRLPRDLFASAVLSVDTLSWHGQVVRDMRLEAVLDQGEVLVQGLSAQLPGNSTLSVDGALTAADGQPVFEGGLRLRSDNLRAVLSWAGIAADTIAQNRLRAFELSSPLRLAWPDLNLADFRLTLDNSHARGALAARLGARPGFGVSASIDNLNLDAYGQAASQAMPAGAAVGGAQSQAKTDAQAQPQGAAEKTAENGANGLGFDADMAIKVANLMVRGVAVTDLSLSALLQNGALDVRSLSGDVAGSRLGLRGRVMGLDQGETKLEQLAFELDSPQPARLLRAFGNDGAKSLPPLRASGRVNGDAGGKVLNLEGVSLTSGATSLSGQGTVELGGTRPRITADLNAGELNLDPLLGGGSRTGFLLPGGPKIPPFAQPPGFTAVPAAAGAVGVGASPFSRDPLDLSALSLADARITLKAAAISAKGWRIEQAQAKLDVQDGNANLDHLTGNLHGGSVEASAKLAAQPQPAFSANWAVTGADLSRAPLDLGGGLRVIQGRMDTRGKLAAMGRSSQDMAASLSGDGGLTVKDGVLDGFDLPAVNQRLGNMNNIGGLLAMAQSGLAGGRTPFSQLSGTFRAENGTVSSRDLKLEAQGGGASAQANVNLPRWSTETAISVHLANAPQAPLGIRFEGPLENPRKIIDINDIQRALVSRGVGRMLQGGEGQGGSGDEGREKNTGKNILKNLFKSMGGQ